MINDVRKISSVITRQIIRRKQIQIGQIFKTCRHISGAVKNSMEEKNDYQEVVEGKADIILPKSVFYNPVQEFNRDLTVAVISQYTKDKFESSLLGTSNQNGKDGTKTSENQQTNTGSVVAEEDKNNLFEEIKPGTSHGNGIRILEGLAASGLRSVRFGLEIPGVKEITANDFDKGAVEFIEKNITRNKLEGLLKSNYGDAAMVMYQNKDPRDRFDVIDLDPYGSPSQFLDSAVQAIKDDGLLCITCTDMAVLCGTAGETCYSKYGAMSIKEKYCHEMALRIVLQCIESHANRYSRYIVPLLAISADFYVRVFVKVYSGQGKVKRSVSKMAMVYNCVGCGAYSLQRLGNVVPTKGDKFKYTPSSGPPVNVECEHCGSKHRLGGPLWADCMYDVMFLNRVIESVKKEPERFKTSQRIIGMLTMMTEELPDIPLYYIVDELCSVIHCNTIPLIQFRSALLNAGYRVSMSHAAKCSVKTDAPVNVIWDILRKWVKLNPIKKERITPGSVVEKILSKEPTTDVSFDIHPEANPVSREKKLLRWQVNPEREWGPKARAKRGATADNQSLTQKKIENQGKRKKNKHYRDARLRNMKQYPCKDFIAGQCERGEECRYIHDESHINEQSTPQDKS